MKKCLKGKGLIDSLLPRLPLSGLSFVNSYLEASPPFCGLVLYSASSPTVNTTKRERKRKGERVKKGQKINLSSIAN